METSDGIWAIFVELLLNIGCYWVVGETLIFKLKKQPILVKLKSFKIN